MQYALAATTATTQTTTATSTTATATATTKALALLADGYACNSAVGLQFSVFTVSYPHHPHLLDRRPYTPSAGPRYWQSMTSCFLCTNGQPRRGSWTWRRHSAYGHSLAHRCMAHIVGPERRGSSLHPAGLRPRCTRTANGERCRPSDAAGGYFDAGYIIDCPSPEFHPVRGAMANGACLCRPPAQQ